MRVPSWLPALLGGHVQVLFAAYPSLAGAAESKKVKLLAQNGEGRWFQAPDVHLNGALRELQLHGAVVQIQKRNSRLARQAYRSCADMNFAMSATSDVTPVADPMPRASTKGSTSRVPSGMRRPYGTASPGTFRSTLESFMSSGLKILRST